MFMLHNQFALVSITKTSNFKEIAIDHVKNFLDKSGIHYVCLRGPVLILYSRPENTTITMCDCGDEIFIDTAFKVKNPTCYSDGLIESAFTLTSKDKWCGVVSNVYEDEHTISLQMVVPCPHDGLLSFAKSWEKFEDKLKTFKAEASKIGLEIVSDDDTDPAAVNA